MASENTNNEEKLREEVNWCIEYLELKLPNVGEKQGKKKFHKNYFKIRAGSCASELGLKVFCRLKVNWKDFLQKNFAIHFTCSESCTLSKVNCKQRKSIGTQNK